MDKRGRVKLSFVPTDKVVMILQNMGYLNKRGRTTRLNLNEFLNRTVYGMVGVSQNNGELLEKLIQSEMNAEVQAHSKRNDEHAQKLRTLAQKLHEVQRQKKVTDYEGKDEGS